MSRSSLEIDSITAVDIEIFLLFDIAVSWEEVIHFIPRKITLYVDDNTVFNSFYRSAFVDIKIETMMDAIC